MGKDILAQDATTKAIVVSSVTAASGTYVKVTMKASDIALRPPLRAQAGSIGLAVEIPLRLSGGTLGLPVGGGLGLTGGTIVARLVFPLLLSSGTIGIGTMPANKVPVSLMLKSSGGTVVLTIQAPLRQDGNSIGIGTVPANKSGALDILFNRVGTITSGDGIIVASSVDIGVQTSQAAAAPKKLAGVALSISGGSVLVRTHGITAVRLSSETPTVTRGDLLRTSTSIGKQGLFAVDNSPASGVRTVMALVSQTGVTDGTRGSALINIG